MIVQVRKAKKNKITMSGKLWNEVYARMRRLTCRVDRPQFLSAMMAQN